MKAWLIRQFLFFLSLLPLKVIHYFGTILGLLSYHLKNRDYFVTSRNINYCFPDLEGKKREILIKKALIESAKTLCELGPAWLWNPNRLNQSIVSIKNEHLIDNALNEKQGIMIVSPHFGSWEILGPALAKKSRLTIMYTQQKDERLDKIIRQARTRYGIDLAPANMKGIKQLMDELKKGKMIGILPDQVPNEGAGIQSSFLAKPAYTMTLVSKLISKTSPLVIFAVLERLPKSKGFTLHYYRPDDLIFDKKLENSVLGLNKSVEECLKISTEQYIWNYKRFKDAGPGSPDIYKKN